MSYIAPVNVVVKFREISDILGGMSLSFWEVYLASFEKDIVGLLGCMSLTS